MVVLLSIMHIGTMQLVERGGHAVSDAVMV
jgi:hypothetical protein